MSIGKMLFDEVKGRGIIDRSFGGRRIFMNKGAAYLKVLDIMRQETFPSDDLNGKHV